MNSLLTSISEDLFRTLLKDWIGVKGIVLLDSAVCNRQISAHFLAFLQLHSVTLLPTKHFSLYSYFDWMVRRGIPIRLITVQNSNSASKGVVQKDRQTMISKFKKAIGLKNVYLAKWLCKILPVCANDLQSLGIVTIERQLAITPQVITTISTCTQLRELHLVYERTSQTAPVGPLHIIMQRCQLLEELHLSGCAFTLQDAISVSIRLTLFSFKHRGKVHLTPLVLVNLFTRCTALQEVHIQEWVTNEENFTECAFNANVYQVMAQRLPHLWNFDLLTWNIHLSGFEKLVGSCGNLRELRLGFCPTLSVDTLTALILHSNLIKVALDNNWSMSGALSMPLHRTHSATARLSNIKLLTLRSFAALTDAGLLSILIHCPALMYLCLDDCRLVTVDTVDAIVQHSSKMKLVELWGCQLLRPDVVMSRLQELKPSIAFMMT